MAGFFEKVYQLIQMIPRGKVASYGQIAAYLGHPRGARMVGWALHSLPEGTEVPWHRVVNARGYLSTPHEGNGVRTQRQLLEKEGVVFDSDGRIDMSAYRWEGPSWAQLDRLLRQE